MFATSFLLVNYEVLRQLPRGSVEAGHYASLGALLDSGPGGTTVSAGCGYSAGSSLPDGPLRDTELEVRMAQDLEGTI